MDKEKRDKIIKVMNLVSEDMENDARDFDGQPFNDNTVASYFGKQGAAIKAVADAVRKILMDNEEGADEP